MKKIIFTSITLFTGLVLIACSNDAQTNNTITNSEEKNSQISTSTPPTTDNQEITDGPLTKVGQWKHVDGLGKLELLKSNDTPTVLSLTEGLDISIKSVKLFQADDITEFNPMLIKTDKKTGNIIQIVASAMNNTDKEYGGLFPKTIVLSDHTQIEHNYSLTTSVNVKPHAKNDEIVTFYYIGDKTTDSIRIFYDKITDEQGYGISELKAETLITLE